MMKKMITTGMLLFVGTLASFSLPMDALRPSGQGVNLDITSSGKSSYTILLPGNPTPQDEAAAQILRDTIQQISGAVLPVVQEGVDTPTNRLFSIGQTKASKHLPLVPKMKQDGYRIAVESNNCFLQGGEQRGAVNAVVALLEEDLGCRWYSKFMPPVLPKTPDLRANVVPRSYQPPLEVRSVFIVEAWDENWVIMNRASPLTEKPKLDPAFGWNRSYPNGGWFAHTFARLAPSSELMETHPEYFALIHGARIPKNICLTNPDVVKIVAENANKILDKNPDARLFSISPNDGEHTFCKCPRCKKLAESEGSNSGLLLNFVNKVTKLINAKHPDVKVSTLAYLEAYLPPKNIKPAPNVVIFLATDRHVWPNPFHYIDETQEFQSALAGWNQIAKEIHLWDYVFGDNSNWMNPSPNFDVIAHNLRIYLQYEAVTGVFFQDNYISIGDSRAAMKNWILTKLMWNPAWDVKELERDFTLSYYGAAGPAMQEYNNLLRSEWSTYHAATPVNSEEFAVGSNFLATAQGLIAKAKQAVADNELLTKEVEREEACLLYQRLENGPMNPGDIEPFLAEIEKMRTICEKLGITSFSEASTFESRFDMWKFSAFPEIPLPTPNTIRLDISDVGLPIVCGPATASIVDEPAAPSHMAIYQPCPIAHWSIQWKVAPDLFVKTGEKYIVRFRVKCGPLKQEQQKRKVLYCGLYSHKTLYTFRRDYSVEELSQKKYTWLTAATIDIPLVKQVFYVGPVEDSAAEYFYVDCVEFIPESEYQTLEK